MNNTATVWKSTLKEHLAQRIDNPSANFDQEFEELVRCIALEGSTNIERRGKSTEFQRMIACSTVFFRAHPHYDVV